MVRRRGGIIEETIGFFDSEDIEPGEEWPDRLKHGLCTSSVFVSLFSPTYFTREYCGREWQIFRERQEAYGQMVRSGTNLLPPVILPVLWYPLSSRPHVITNIQDTSDEFGETYAKEGLQYLMRISRYKDEYQDFLTRFTDKLLQLARIYPMPPFKALRPLKDYPSAFHPPGAYGVTPYQTGERVGPRYVQFIFVAGKRDELQQERVRNRLEFYGPNGGWDWRPYVPQVQKMVSALVQAVTADADFGSDVVALNTNILQQIQAAWHENKIVVLVVDTWTLMLQRYRNCMLEYDTHDFLNCAVLVVWNDQDDETMKNRSMLERAVINSFPIKASSAMQYFIMDRITSPSTLESVLTTILEQVQQRIIRFGNVAKRIESDIRKPVLAVS